MSATVLGVSQTSAFAAPVTAVPVPAPAPTDSQAALDNTGSVVTPADVCFFETNGDYVHISSSAFEASGHGWWTNINCNTSTAVVTVQLQEYYSDGKWRNVGTVGRSTVRSGGGSGARATGRAGCLNRNLAGWRSVVDVDLVGLPDDPRKLTTPARNLNCSR
jgi:hypothetical protein